MQNLEKFSKLKDLQIPDITLDHFQQQILDNLYLEFFLEGGRCLITPEFTYLTTAAPTEQEESTLAEILANSTETLNRMKVYLLYNLSFYSSLLETNSYYIALNDHLLISRFVSMDGHPDDYEVKLYTISRADLPDNYKDKIYLGRDFVSLKSFRREHFGLRHIRNSLQDQHVKLIQRIEKFVAPEVRDELEKEYLYEIGEIIDEYTESANRLLETTPAFLGADNLPREEIINANKKFRDLKHMLIEIEESIRELETHMFELDLMPVRYVTKFRNDVINDINYCMLKVNGRISDYVNGIHI